MALAKQRRNRPTALDLFAGCGGLTEGLKAAGFRVLGAVEIEEKSAETYKLNHPEVHLWIKDIQDLSTLTVTRKLALRKGRLDLLAGCPPCQGFSTMRTLNGHRSNRDRRNDLLFEFLRFVEGLRPKAIMMENVPGLARNGRFKEFCARLRELGYIGKYDVLDAANYGVPQRRQRLIYLAGFKRPVAFADPRKKEKTVRQAISILRPAGNSGDSLHDIPERRSPDVQRKIEIIPKDGGSRSSLPPAEQLACHKTFSGFKDVYGRMAWDKVAPTITTGCFNPSKGRFLHPDSDRAITIREAALLQGFRRRYKFRVKHGKIALALMIGNALPPPFITAHARSVATALRHRRTAHV